MSLANPIVANHQYLMGIGNEDGFFTTFVTPSTNIDHGGVWCTVHFIGACDDSQTIHTIG